MKPNAQQTPDSQASSNSHPGQDPNAIDPQDIADGYDAVFSASYRRIMGDGAYNPEFIAAFYVAFLESSDEIAKRFSATDMSRQKTMLHDSLNTLVDFSGHKRLSPQMQRLAAVHGPGAADIAPELYDLWLKTLMETVSAFDERYDKSVDLAWRLTLAPGIDYLKFTYAHPDYC